MFCIAAFLVFLVLSVFSATFRPLAAQAWHCVARRLTLRPCDISFSQEMKGKLVGALIFRTPRLARFVQRWIDWLSFLFVALSIWSLVYVAVAGLNLWVYDTCDPRSAESCSLSGEACGIEQESLSLLQSVQSGRVGEYIAGPILRFAETISRIPDRVRTWEPTQYLPPVPSYHAAFDPTKPTVLEVIDPSCTYCKKLTGNLKQSGILDEANVTYVLYPIPLPEGGYKFPHSYVMASYLEAIKQVPVAAMAENMPPADWQLLLRIFAPAAPGETDIQTRITIGMTDADVRAFLRLQLLEIGYTESEVARIVSLADSSAIRHSLEEQRILVEERIRTVKIPTLLIGGRRYDRVVDAETLQRSIR